MEVAIGLRIFPGGCNQKIELAGWEWEAFFDALSKKTPVWAGCCG
jgi:hypothetical protein